MTELLKLIEGYLPLIAVIFTISGLLLGAYVTWSFRNKSLSGQKQIIRMNDAIDAAVTRIGNLNQDISNAQENLTKITTKTQNLSGENINITKDVKEITEDVKKVQDNLLLISEKNNELAESARELVKDLTNFQTGGNMYLSVFCEIYDNGEHIFLQVEPTSNEDEKYIMRNVKIKIIDNLIEVGKRKEFPVAKEFKDRVIKSNGTMVEMELGDIRPYRTMRLLEFNSDDYNEQLNFSIWAESDNFNTQQELYVRNITGKTLRYSKIVIDSRSKRRGQVLSETPKKNFPFKNGRPDIDRRK